MFVYVIVSLGFLIQDGFSLKYVKAHGVGLIMMVDMIDTATQWEAIQVGDNPTILAIQKQGTSLCLDLIPGLNELSTSPFLEKKTQKFKINLKPDGYYQIVQDDRLFVFYEVVSNQLKAARRVPDFTNGFKLVTDDGSRAWPTHIITQHNWL